jgi:hypothetical protein
MRSPSHAIFITFLNHYAAPAGWSVRVVVASEVSFEFSDLLFEFQNVAISVGELLSEGVDFGFEVGDALFQRVDRRASCFALQRHSYVPIQLLPGDDFEIR